jgi:mxaK protein
MAIAVRRRLAVASLGALAVSLAGLALSAHSLYETRALNALILRGQIGDLANEAPPEAWFAKAYELRDKGHLGTALKLYHQLEQVPGREFQVRVNYNIGNIYVTRAQIDAQLARYKDISTLVGIARAQYQRALRLDSDFYDAKYNLEYTRFLVTERETQQEKYEGGLGRRYEERRTEWAEFPRMPIGLP